MLGSSFSLIPSHNPQLCTTKSLLSPFILIPISLSSTLHSAFPFTALTALSTRCSFLYSDVIYSATPSFVAVSFFTPTVLLSLLKIVVVRQKNYRGRYYHSTHPPTCKPVISHINPTLALLLCSCSLVPALFSLNLTFQTKKKRNPDIYKTVVLYSGLNSSVINCLNLNMPDNSRGSQQKHYYD